MSSTDFHVQSFQANAINFCMELCKDEYDNFPQQTFTSLNLAVEKVYVC